MKNIITIGALCVLTAVLAGCASQKSKPLAQRGWIGGEYTLAKRGSFMTQFDNGPGLARNLPKPLAQLRKCAIKITHLSTNTPAALAGLRPDDFIVELNHRPVTSLTAFRRTIDRSRPGTLLPVKAWRDGKFVEDLVPVGLESYRHGGYFSIAVPTVVHRWDLWPNPGFSLVCIGYEPDPGLRYDTGDEPRGSQVYDRDWDAYLVFLEVSYGERVVAQEPMVKVHGG